MQHPYIMVNNRWHKLYVKIHRRGTMKQEQTLVQIDQFGRGQFVHYIFL